MAARWLSADNAASVALRAADVPARLEDDVAAAIFQLELYARVWTVEEGLHLLALMHADVTCPTIVTLVYDGMDIMRMNSDNGTAWFDPGELEALVASEACRGKQFIIVHFMLNSEAGAYHCNALLIDRRARTVELFDPHGAQSMFGEEGGADLHVQLRYFLDAALPGFVLLPSKDFCPLFGGERVGIQEIFTSILPNSHISGSCAVWTLWYVHNRLRHPTWPAARVRQAAVNNVVFSGSMERTAVGRRLERFIEDFTRDVMERVGITLGAPQDGFICGRRAFRFLDRPLPATCRPGPIRCFVTGQGREVECVPATAPALAGARCAAATSAGHRCQRRRTHGRCCGQHSAMGHHACGDPRAAP